MSASEQLENNHLLVIQSVDNLPDVEWDMPNVCGTWSVKDIIAHITSYERLLIDVFRTFLEQSPDTPYLSKYIKQNSNFNDTEVEARRYHTAQQVIDEYEEAQGEAASLLARIPPETLSQQGTMPWYGSERSLNDFINGINKHIRHHCEQIATFRQREKL